MDIITAIVITSVAMVVLWIFFHKQIAAAYAILESRLRAVENALAGTQATVAAHGTQLADHTASIASAHSTAASAAIKAAVASKPQGAGESASRGQK